MEDNYLGLYTKDSNIVLIYMIKTWLNEKMEREADLHQYETF